jgi:hypothetical protein
MDPPAAGSRDVVCFVCFKESTTHSIMRQPTKMISTLL